MASKQSTPFQNTKFLLNALERRVQGTLRCAQENLWAEVLKRLVLGPVLTGNKNRNMKTKTPGRTKKSGEPRRQGNIKKEPVFMVQFSLGLESGEEIECCALPRCARPLQCEEEITNS